MKDDVINGGKQWEETQADDLLWQLLNGAVIKALNQDGEI